MTPVSSLSALVEMGYVLGSSMITSPSNAMSMISASLALPSSSSSYMAATSSCKNFRSTAYRSARERSAVSTLPFTR